MVLRNYTYDALGHPLTRSTSRNGTTQNDTFGYNARSELTSATLGSDNYAYAFDHLGNRATEAIAIANGESQISNYTANNLNQYTDISLGEAVSSPLQYDTDGTATLVQTSTGTWQITYNGENRPIRFENTATQTVVECVYDSQGLNVSFRAQNFYFPKHRPPAARTPTAKIRCGKARDCRRRTRRERRQARLGRIPLARVHALGKAFFGKNRR